MEVINAIGRRKEAVARIYMSEGKGQITINKRDISNYFPAATLQYIVKQPLNVIGVVDNYDIKINLNGGGFKGQAAALSLAVSRALCQIDAENRPPLKAKGLLRRDSRMVERKKFGQPKARKKFQFSKR